MHCQDCWPTSTIRMVLHRVQQLQQKSEKNDTTLRCYECNEPNVVGILRYRFELSVRDNDDEATFVIFDRDGATFTGRTSTELRNELLKGGDDGDDKSLEITSPQCLIDLIGRTCKFQVQITKYNFRASRQTITVSEVLDKNVTERVQPVENKAEEKVVEANKEESRIGTQRKTKGSDEVAAAENNKEKRLRTN